MNGDWTPYEMLVEIDRAMPYAVFDRAQFLRLCIAREHVAGDCADIGEAFGAFVRGVARLSVCRSTDA